MYTYLIKLCTNQIQQENAAIIHLYIVVNKKILMQHTSNAKEIVIKPCNAL
jgi:hypothetical protein